MASPHNGNAQKKVFIAFLRFLKEQKVYISYFSELKLNKSANSTFVEKHNKKLFDFFNYCAPYFWIQYGFTWIKTKKGDIFWRELNEKWKSKYKNEILRK